MASNNPTRIFYIISFTFYGEILFSGLFSHLLAADLESNRNLSRFTYMLIWR